MISALRANAGGLRLLKISDSLKFIALLCVVSLLQLPAFACATCGCSEVCPIAMSGAEINSIDRGLLSDSIWGNIILKMAYNHDEQLQSLLNKRGAVDNGTVGALVAISAGTLGQNISGIATLNPPEGVLDSYSSGIVGLALEGAINIVFAGSAIAQHKIHGKVKKRQLELRAAVETILGHLEFSKTDCPEARDRLTQLIGEHGADECLQLWQSSHVTAQLLPKAEVLKPVVAQ